MYLVSNSDLDLIKRIIADYAANTDIRATRSLRVINEVRLAKNLLAKLEAKQPFPKNALPDTLKRF